VAGSATVSVASRSLKTPGVARWASTVRPGRPRSYPLSTCATWS
jgi:hypothetical protein